MANLAINNGELTCDFTVKPALNTDMMRFAASFQAFVWDKKVHVVLS